MKWQKIKINTIGFVGEKQKIIFIPLEELKDVACMTSSCGCSTPRIVDGKVEVTYTPGAIPSHLSSQGFYKSTNKVTITYYDNVQDKLSFTVLVKRKIKKL